VRCRQGEAECAARRARPAAARVGRNTGRRRRVLPHPAQQLGAAAAETWRALAPGRSRRHPSRYRNRTETRSLSLSLLLACLLSRPLARALPIALATPFTHPSVAVQPRARLPKYFLDQIFRKCFAKLINGTGRRFSPAPLHPNRASVPCGRARDRTGSLLNFDPFGFVHEKAIGFSFNLLGSLFLSLSLFEHVIKKFVFSAKFSVKKC
jgi:hypothetical protein